VTQDIQETKWAKVVPELLVTSFPESLDFYTKLIGFKILYDRPEARFAYLDLNGAQIMLDQSADPWLTGPMQKPFGRGINLQIEVNNVSSIVAALTEANWPIYQELQDAWYRCGAKERGNRQFLVQDPDGYLLRCFEDLGVRARLSEAK
jgi:catechol 2,3-dioxygenase-like lactoylglutathione lyase family enzyme